MLEVKTTIWVKRNIEARFINQLCQGKAINVTYPECVSVILFVQHENGMCPTILSSVTLCLCHIFPHYLIKATIFEKKLLNIKYVF
jgi:hypothetical protein